MMFCPIRISPCSIDVEFAGMRASMERVVLRFSLAKRENLILQELNSELADLNTCRAMWQEHLRTHRPRIIACSHMDFCRNRTINVGRDQHHRVLRSCSSLIYRR